MRQTNSDEFAAQPDLRLPRFAEGDRVEVVASRITGTVVEAHFYSVSWTVTVLLDDTKQRERFTGRDLRKIESLF